MQVVVRRTASLRLSAVASQEAEEVETPPSEWEGRHSRDREDEPTIAPFRAASHSSLSPITQLLHAPSLPPAHSPFPHVKRPLRRCLSILLRNPNKHDGALYLLGRLHVR